MDSSPRNNPMGIGFKYELSRFIKIHFTCITKSLPSDSDCDLEILLHGSHNFPSDLLGHHSPVSVTQEQMHWRLIHFCMKSEDIAVLVFSWY